MTNKKIQPESIEIENIRIVHSTITTSEGYENNPEKPDQIEVQYKQDSAFNIEKKRIRIRLTTSLEGLDKNRERLGVSGEFMLEFHIYVDNMEDYIIEEYEEKRVSDLLGNTLMGIVYSTARGIIYERIHGTYLSGCILPVIDPRNLIK
jgi:hypothetical protein